METKAKVKYRGIQVGEVESIDYAGQDAKLTLAIRSDDMRYIRAMRRSVSPETRSSAPSRWSS